MRIWLAHKLMKVVYMLLRHDHGSSITGDPIKCEMHKSPDDSESVSCTSNSDDYLYAPLFVPLNWNCYGENND